MNDEVGPQDPGADALTGVLAPAPLLAAGDVALEPEPGFAALMLGLAVAPLPEHAAAPNPSTNKAASARPLDRDLVDIAPKIGER